MVTLKNKEIAKTFNDCFGGIINDLDLHDCEDKKEFEEVKKIIRDLKTNKAVGGEIPTKMLKECEFYF